MKNVEKHGKLLWKGTRTGEKGIKKGYRRSPNLDNLKSNTMKNTVQKYEIYLFLVYRKQKIYILAVIF